MKFVISYTMKSGGSVEERVAGGEAAQKLLANWTPSPSATIHQWVERCDGGGGFSVIETDNAKDLFKDLTTWSPWIDFQLYPVIDIVEGTALTDDALHLARSVV